ncbi:hypothetical protein ACFQ07_10490 [Actinomadura adrarensis]|uniref:CopG family transcriptional regulator n=1 Tax=Actinomadura adrarensis TaxID=1819600 RepID=A0ABW3CDP0_9ACTN
MPCTQTTDCNEPDDTLTVSIPADIKARMVADAQARGITVDEMVTAAFDRIGNRICPTIATG